MASRYKVTIEDTMGTMKHTLSYECLGDTNTFIEKGKMGTTFTFFDVLPRQGLSRIHLSLEALRKVTSKWKTEEHEIYDTKSLARHLEEKCGFEPGQYERIIKVLEEEVNAKQSTK